MWLMFILLLIKTKQVIITLQIEPPSLWRILPLLKSNLSFLFLTLAILDIKSHPRLDYQLLLSPEFVPDTAPTFQKLLEAVLPSFHKMIYDMLFDLLALERLKMQFKWPNHFKKSPTSPSHPRQLGIGSRKWGWRQWWRRKDLFLVRGIEGKG